MSKASVNISLIISILSLAVSGYIAKQVLFEKKPSRGTVSYEYLKNFDSGDEMFVTGYLKKSGFLYYLYPSEKSSLLEAPNGFQELAIIHPAENIDIKCQNSWVNVVGVAYWTGFGDSLDFVKLISSAEGKGECMLKKGNPIKYLNELEKLAKEHK